jgi:glutamine cyclotransferase
MKSFSAFVLLFSVTGLGGCPGPGAPVGTPVFTYSIVEEFPHDAEAFTQGLVFYDGRLYEGTGLWGRSTVREVELETGVVSRSRDLDASYFGEGLTLFGDRMIQLTWRSKVGFVYDRDSFEVLREFDYPSQVLEGWGITHDGEFLIVSDGTPVLHFLDPETFVEVASVEVFDGEDAVGRLNELEYVGGEIYANVWQTDRIARIDPDTGSVASWIDLSGLLPVEDRAAADWLNGIAYDAANDRLFVTGKLWPTLFEIALSLAES